MPKIVFFQNEGVIVAEDSAASAGYLKDTVNDFCRIARYSENFEVPIRWSPSRWHSLRAGRWKIIEKKCRKAKRERED